MTSSRPNYLPKVPPLNTTKLGVRAPKDEFREDTSIQSPTVTLKELDTKTICNIKGNVKLYHCYNYNYLKLLMHMGKCWKEIWFC